MREFYLAIVVLSLRWVRWGMTPLLVLGYSKYGGWLPPSAAVRSCLVVAAVLQGVRAGAAGGTSTQRPAAADDGESQGSRKSQRPWPTAAAALGCRTTATARCGCCLHGRRGRSGGGLRGLRRSLLCVRQRARLTIISPSTAPSAAKRPTKRNLKAFCTSTRPICRQAARDIKEC